jgi:hypothetical protein
MLDNAPSGLYRITAHLTRCAVKYSAARERSVGPVSWVIMKLPAKNRAALALKARWPTWKLTEVLQA